MPAITSLGIGSGVDINSMVSQLVALERKPLDQMRAEASRLQTQVSSYGKLNSLFSTLQDASNKLASATLWAGTDFVTTAPAPITLPAPIATPFKTRARAPMNTSFSMTIGSDLPPDSESRRRSAGLIG